MGIADDLDCIPCPPESELSVIDMNQMLDVFDEYAQRYNISFGTDPNPAKSKSKCIFMVGDGNP